MTPASDTVDLGHRLEKAEQLLACFQQAVGHDLPNHLVSLQGLLRILELEDAGSLSPEGREYLRRLAALALRMQALIGSLAEIGRTRRQAHPAEPLLLEEVAREAAAELNQLYPGRSLEYDFSHACLVLTSARPALRRVLVQLMRHAVQAAPEDRRLHIAVGGRPGVEFWVADDGGGLTPEQLHQARELCAGRPAKQTDLGLVLVAQLVDQWHATVRVDAEPGKGTVFTVVLPPG
jgi:signal transduction histidine kinase